MRYVRIRFMLVGLVLASLLVNLSVSGCQSDTPAPPASGSGAASPAQPSPNLPQDHLLKTQTDALQRAKAAQDTINEAAQRRAQEMEEQAGN